MPLRLLLASVVLSLLACGPGLSATKGDAPHDEARQAILRASAYFRSTSVEGGYVWTASEDLSVRAGEALVTPTQVWVQAPGTAAVGETYLRAYEVLGNETLLEFARDAALALVRGQLLSGGWDYLIEFDPALRAQWAYRIDAPSRVSDSSLRNTTTYDDDNTQGALRFLLNFATATEAAGAPCPPEIRNALDYGLKRLLDAQYPNGAWPQRWNGQPHDAIEHPVTPAVLTTDYPRQWPKSTYYGHYTLNDNSHHDLLLTLLLAHQKTGRPEYLEGLRAGVRFLKLAQLPAPQAGWAQQYDARMRPAWARAFEPPAISSAESAGVIRLLSHLYLETGDESFLEPIPAAIEWLERSEISPGKWARLYEQGTNKPLYGDRDGQIHFSRESISAERQRGYAWEGVFNIPSSIKVARCILATRDSGSAEREALLKREFTARSSGDKFEVLKERAEPVIASLDQQGRWLTPVRGSRLRGYTGPLVESAVFIRNIRLLCDYLEKSGAGEATPAAVSAP